MGLPVPDDRYPKSYDLHSLRAKLREILKAMVITVAAVPSTLSGKLGVTIFGDGKDPCGSGIHERAETP